MKVNRANTLLLTVIGVATLLVAVIGATFAYFTATITNGEEGTTITVGAGKLEIAYYSASGSEEDIQVVDDIKPEINKSALTKIFTITGTNSTDSVMPYTLELVVTENLFSENALSYTLTSENTGSNGAVVELTGTSSLPKVESGPLSIDLGGEGYFAGIIPEGGATHTYTLDIFFQETYVNQDEDKGATFGAYVNTIPGHARTTTTTTQP